MVDTTGRDGLPSMAHSVSIADADSGGAPGSNGRRPALKGSNQSRMIELDVLRGIAIILVLFRHSLSGPYYYQMGFLQPIAAPLVRVGWSGVDLFFVLSGFLVGGRLLQEIRKNGLLNAGRFLIRRGFKIWPGYFVFIAYCAAKLWRRGSSPHEVLRALWPNLVHLQNYLPHRGPWPGQTWSLAVEEHFYLALPALFLLLMRGSTNRSRLSNIPWIALSLSVVCLAFRILNWTVVPDGHVRPTHLRIDSLFLGVCISYFYHFRSELFLKLRQYRFAIGVTGIALLIPLFFFEDTDRFVYTVGFTLAAVGYGCILIAVVPYKGDRDRPAGFWNSHLARLVAWVGVYSYSIYLWHIDIGAEPAGYWLKPVWGSLPRGWHWAAYTALLIIVSVLAGAFMAKLVEFPALRLRDRLFPSLSRSIIHR